MKKKVLRISLMAISFIIILSIYNIVNANEINSVNIVIKISDDGVAHVYEEWQVTTDEGTELKHSFKNMDKMQIINFKVKDEDDSEFAIENNWNSNKDIESKKQKCGMKKSSDEVDLFWGIGEYGSKAYFLEYDITNFVTNLSDGNQMIKIEFFQKDREEIKHLGINMASEDLLFNDIAEVWGYGYKKGLCQINAVGEIYYSSLGKLETGDSVGIIAKFDAESFQNVNTKLNRDFNYYYKDTIGETNSNLVSDKKDVVLILICIFAGLIVFIILTIINKDNRKNKIEKTTKNSNPNR